MANDESIGHVIDDVTWPWKVKVVTPKFSGPIISKTAGDTDLVTIEHLQEMAYVVSNGLMTDDITWPRTVNIVTSVCLGAKLAISKKSDGIGQTPCSYEHNLVIIKIAKGWTYSKIIRYKKYFRLWPIYLFLAYCFLPHTYWIWSNRK